MPAPLDRRTLEAAATWYVHLSATPPTEAERQAWQHWIDQHPSHAQAWTRVEQLQRQLGDLPQDIALPTLAGVQARRRAVLKTLTLLLGAGTMGWIAQETISPQVWLAEYRTAKGQRRQLSLSDGSQLNLNTDSALDLIFDQQRRLVRLYHGEVLIETASDSTHRPFMLETSEGQVRALGTRFSVRTENGRSRVSVLHYAVEVSLSQQPDSLLRLQTGQQLDFSAHQFGQLVALTAGADAWMRGMLSVIDWRLDDFIAELSRYRLGYLRCSPEVAELRLSGAFNIDNTDIALENLSRSLPIKVRYLTRYWVNIEPA